MTFYPVPIKNPRLIMQAWTENPTRHWFARCDTCGKRRIHGDVYEAHGREDPDSHTEPRVWWRVCSRCLILIFSRLDELDRELNAIAEAGRAPWR